MDLMIDMGVQVTTKTGHILTVTRRQSFKMIVNLVYMAMIDPCREHHGMVDSRCSAELRNSYNSTRMRTNRLVHPLACRPFYCPGRSFHCHGSDLLLQPSLSDHSCYKVHVVSRNAYYLSIRINALIACSSNWL